MARAATTGFDANSFLRRLSQVYDEYPFILVGWVHSPGSLSEDSYVLSVGQAGQTIHRRGAISISSASVPRAEIRDTGSVLASATAASPTNEWHMIFGELSANFRACSLNDGSRGTQTELRDPNASNSVYIGGRSTANQDVIERAFVGGLAELSLWNGAGMSEAERLQLRDKLYNGGSGGNGANPLEVNDEDGQPWTGKLIPYWDLDFNSPTWGEDLSGNGHHLSEVGTGLTAFEGDPAYPPVEAPPSAGSGAVTILKAMGVI